MEKAKDLLRVLIKDLSIRQKCNYIKSILMPRGVVLGYDPVTISIVATSRCTLSCDMCPTHSRKVPRDYMHAQTNARDIDFEMFRKIIDRFDSALNVQIIGSGEPMLNKDFFRMVDYAVSKKMQVKTFSNGTTVEENIDNILSSGLDGITISINGHNGEEFNRMTGMDADNYKRIYDGVRKLIEKRDTLRSKVKVKLSFIIDNHNYKDISKMIDVTLKLGADQAFLCNFLSCPVEGLTARERSLMAHPDIAEKIRAIVGRYPAEIRKRFTTPLMIDQEINSNFCNSHFTQIRFDGDGNVSSCSMMLLNMEGNGNYRDPVLWNNDFFKSMRKAFLDGDLAALPEPCKVCPDNKGVSIFKV